KRVREALQLTAAALRDDVLIPDVVEVLTRAPIMKPWMYVLGGNFMWKRQAKANGLQPKQLKARPYEVS
ncbi:NAD(P)H dehydrogenase, partial [Candidatus Bipolaricaulota bacterium]|nr:NAD(P)H dehydrogenase [Candidatus Bipolaricaulota bacterium]